MCVNVCMERRNIIWFYFITPLGQRVNFIWCMCSFFFSHSLRLSFTTYTVEKICIKRNHITAYIHIKYKWCEYFNETQFIVTGSMSQLICTKCELRPGFTSSVKGDQKKKRRKSVFWRVRVCQRKKKLSLTVQRTILDWIFLILTDSQFFSPVGSSTSTLQTMCTRMPNIA